MKYKKYGFSFIEIIVSVGISLILMVSVSILTSNILSQLTLSKIILDKSSYIDGIYKDFDNMFDGFLTGNFSSSGFELKTNYFMGKGNFYKVEILSKTGYCINDEIGNERELKFLSIKNFNLFGTGSDGNFRTDPLNHYIYSGSEVLLGKGVFGNNFFPGIKKEDLYLNNPTGIIQAGGKIIFSDTGNSQVLYLSGNRVYKLLGIEQGIRYPTDLKIIGGSLYIVNNDNKEILELDFSGGIIPNSVSISFSGVNVSGVTNISFVFKTLSYTGNILSPTNTGSFIFSGITKGGTGDTVSTGDILNYAFSGGYSQNFVPGTTYGIQINDLSGIFTSTGIYFIEMTLHGHTDKKLYFPFFTKGDNNLFTLEDNIINVFTGGLINYPLKIDNSLNITYENDFGNLTGSVNEKLYDFPWESFDVYENDDFLTIKGVYYKYYDCYNDNNSIKEEFLYKKSLK